MMPTSQYQKELFNLNVLPKKNKKKTKTNEER